MNTITFTSDESLELRSVETKVSKKGKVYYIVHLETYKGLAFALYTTNDLSIYQKGDLVKITITYDPIYKSVILTNMVLA